jgi:hypothetical protein
MIYQQPDMDGARNYAIMIIDTLKNLHKECAQLTKLGEIARQYAYFSARTAAPSMSHGRGY